MERGKNIVILGTGGTIAGVAEQAGANVGYRAAQLEVSELLQAVPGLQRSAGQGELQVEQVAQLDSKDMDYVTWRALAQRCAELLVDGEVAGIVITHGTDTLEETAWFLQCVLQPVKPVVLTCAMRPATAISADGPGNLRDAVVCAAGAQAAGRGVLAVVAGRVFTAREVRKSHPYRVDAFEGTDSGAQGWVEEGAVRWAQYVPRQLGLVALPSVQALPEPQAWPLVEMLTSHAGYNHVVAMTLLKAWHAVGVKGVVLAGTGNGTVHQALIPALNWAKDQGMFVRLTTRCEQGQVVQAAGVTDPLVSTLPAVKARISLMLELMGWPRTDRC